MFNKICTFIPFPAEPGYILLQISVRMKKIHPKIKALEWSQYFSHYKSMGIFSNAQGQLTP